MLPLQFQYINQVILLGFPSPDQHVDNELLFNIVEAAHNKSDQLDQGLWYVV